MNRTEIKSPTKLQVIDFVKNCKEDENYVFQLEGTADYAQDFIHRMRVDLSRLRNMVKDRGHVPKHFKMLIMSIVPLTETETLTQIVTLRKSISPHDVSNVLNEIFDDVAGGKMIEGGSNDGT